MDFADLLVAFAVILGAPAAVVGWAVIQLKLQQRLEKWAETHPPKRRGKV